MPEPTGITWMRAVPVSGSHVATADDASANAISFDTGRPAASVFLVQCFRAGANIGGDVKASLTAGVLKVEDGSTYKITAGDVINWIVI